MSDLSIPGVTSKYNTQKVIDALMEVERAPLKRMEADVAASQQKKAAWQDVARRISGLRDGARGLYGFQNPFVDKIAGSSDEKVFTASATRTATEETKSILVRRIATADRFLSAPLARDFVVEAGEYAFRVGEKEAKFSFRGGSLKEFADALNSRAGTVVRASIVNDTKNTQVLLIEGTQTGAANRLTFLGASVGLATKAGMLERSQTASRSLSLTPASLTGGEKPGSRAVAGGALTLDPGGEARIPVSPALPLNPNMVLELSVRTERIPEDAVPAVKPPPGPTVPGTGSVEYGGIRIDSDPSLAPLPEWTPPPPPPRVSDMQVLFMEGDGKVLPLPEITDSTEFVKIQVPVGELAGRMDAIVLQNRNTHRRVVVRDIAAFDKTQRGDYVPTRALAQAGDAELEMDGIDVRRPSNAIDDLVPGVTLTLKGPGSSPVDLTVRRNVENIVQQILTVVGSYNRTITDIDVLTRRDASIIESAGYLSDDEKKKAAGSLGLLIGDLSLAQLKSAMQNVMMNPYPTSKGRDLSLLAQIGISTDTRAPGSGGLDKTKLRGYLEVDEAKLTEAIERFPDAVKELFGADTDGDLAVNAGAAFALDALLRPYVATGGILPLRVTTLDRSIADKNREITAYNRHLDDYLAQLKRKYGQMEGALGTLEKNSQAIQNFGKQNTTP
jgi:flagellar hook-associated protein 2